MIAKTATRVEEHTRPELNAGIDEMIRRRIELYEHATPERIRERLDELDREWDVERVLEANAASMVLLTLTLGKLVSRRFYAFTAVIGGFLLQHAVQGWCPPVPVLRRLGVRTSGEIEKERRALLRFLCEA